MKNSDVVALLNRCNAVRNVIKCQLDLVVNGDVDSVGRKAVSEFLYCFIDELGVFQSKNIERWFDDEKKKDVS